MKLKLIEDKTLKETIIDITYNIFDSRIQRIIDVVNTSSIQLKGEQANKQYLIDSLEVYYIESVDGRTFIYTEKQVFESKNKLYELEEKLKKTSFIKINKSTILNMNYLVSVEPLINYRLEANLINTEKLIISRHYMKDVKQYLNI